jgi:Flp pilus assembly protein TadD
VDEESFYERYVLARELLNGGQPDLALRTVEPLVEMDPQARSLRELYARALYDSGRRRESFEQFEQLAHADPADDYAQFGMGLAARRLGDLEVAAEHLATAVALRPDLPAYVSALADVRATRRARERTAS